MTTNRCLLFEMSYETYLKEDYEIAMNEAEIGKSQKANHFGIVDEKK